MSNTTARSVSRGRESNTYASSGRGGAGNIVPASGSPDAERRPGEAGPDDYSLSRGRELPPPSNQTGNIGSGRGGAGNVYAPSRGAAVENISALREEAKYVRELAKGDAPVSQGRGGAGNISNSRSRSRTRDAAGAVSPAKAGEAGTASLGRLAEEGHGQSPTREHHSGLSKITNLFHRGSRDATKFTPEVPEH